MQKRETEGGLRPSRAADLEAAVADLAHTGLWHRLDGSRVDESRGDGVLGSPPATAPATASRTPAARSAGAATAADVSLADWSVLLDAVKLRLRASVALPDGLADGAGSGEGVKQLRTAEGGAGPATVTRPVSAQVHQSSDGDSDRAGSASDAEASARALQQRRTVLECVEALDQLQSTLLHELARRLQLELQVFDGQLALAQARAALSGHGVAAAEAALPPPSLPSGPDAFSRSRHLALHDGLTDLPNRRFFMERLEHGLAHLITPGAQLAVFSLALEGHAEIEAQHGADIAQAVLKVVASRWTHVLRAEDMLSRLDGAEFACLRLAQGGDRAALLMAAGKLIDALLRPISLAALSLPLGVRIGVAQGSVGQGSAPALLGRAELARQRAAPGQVFGEWMSG